MATYGWRESRSVAEGLWDEGHRFSFLQAVRLLEELFPDRTSPAEGIDPRREVVRFRSEVRFDFPPGDVEAVLPPMDGEPAEMRVNVLGLAGSMGPLPPAVVELILERSFRKDTAFRDFLDIFHHRLISLLYRARKKYRPALDRNAPHAGRVATVLHSLLGLGTKHLTDRMGVRERTLLAYTGLLVETVRPTVGLTRMIEDCFDTTAAVSPFRGRWDRIEDADVTRLGARLGRNQVLGESAVLGGRVWDQAAGFEVLLGPLTLAQFLSFLPNGRAFAPLVALVRFYAREELGFTFRLSLAAAEVPEIRLGAAYGTYLGWTSWLMTKPMTRDDSQVRLVGKR
jgi:type VI secretion system protein ImpH